MSTLLRRGDGHRPRRKSRTRMSGPRPAYGRPTELQEDRQEVRLGKASLKSLLSRIEGLKHR